MKITGSFTGRRLAGAAALSFIFLVVAGALVSLVYEAFMRDGRADVFFGAELFQIVRFTVWQAVLSTLASVGLAIPVALALARNASFAGRKLVVNLFGLPLALPALVAVLAVLGFWGRAGWVNWLLPPDLQFSIFGLSGILLAHVFFNLPLATRLFLSVLERIPHENWLLAGQLALPARSVFVLVEWPVVRANLASVAVLVFMLCLSSFTIVLVLGGGPATTTLEVAIYQALRFDFDPARAVVLALLQIGLTVCFLAASYRYTHTLSQLKGTTRRPLRPRSQSVVWRGMESIVIVLAAGFVLAPLASLVVDGLQADFLRLLAWSELWRAIATSVVLALLAGLLCCVLCVMALRAVAQKGDWADRLAMFFSSVILVVPAIVLGSGWFIILHRAGVVFSYTPVLVVVINALMALPFAYRIVSPALAEANRKNARLAAMLGISGWARWKYVDFPVIRKPLALAFSFAMALSLGDLGVIALFASDAITTLPLLLFRSLGSYRSDDAAGLALILSLLCLVVLWLADIYGQRTKGHVAT